MGFGRVLTGMDVVGRIGSAFAVNLRPATPVVIKRVGRLPEAEWAAVDKVLAAEAKAAQAAADKAAAAAGAAAGAPAGGKAAKKAAAAASA